MEIRLLDVAQELDEAVEYYNAEQDELGDQFLLEFLSSLERSSSRRIWRRRA